jgi:hypothetical protein
MFETSRAIREQTSRTCSVHIRYISFVPTGYPSGVFRKISPSTRIDRRIEKLRRAIPLETYLMLMHQAAVTGYLPRLDAAGKVVPAKDDEEPILTPNERIKLMEYLTDKSMPDIRLDAEPAPESIDAVIEAPEAFSSNQLRLVVSPPREAAAG